MNINNNKIVSLLLISLFNNQDIDYYPFKEISESFIYSFDYLDVYHNGVQAYLDLISMNSKNLGLLIKDMLLTCIESEIIFLLKKDKSIKDYVDKKSILTNAKKTSSYLLSGLLNTDNIALDNMKKWFKEFEMVAVKGEIKTYID